MGRRIHGGDRAWGTVGPRMAEVGQPCTDDGIELVLADGNYVRFLFGRLYSFSKS